MSNLTQFIRTRIAHSRLYKGFIRSRGVKGKVSILRAYLKLSMYAWFTPHRTKSIRLLGYDISYGSLYYLKSLFEGSEGMVIKDIQGLLDRVSEIQMEFHYIDGINQLGNMLTIFEAHNHSYRLVPPHYQVEHKNGSLAFIYTRLQES